MDVPHGRQRGLSASSSTSAIDLTGTPAGIGSSAPTTPTLDTSDSRGGFARRRLSWGRVEAGQDPLQIQVPTSNANPLANPPRPHEMAREYSDDVFWSPTEDDIVMRPTYTVLPCVVVYTPPRTQDRPLLPSSPITGLQTQTCIGTTMKRT